MDQNMQSFSFFFHTEKYFKMKKSDCKEALEIYKRFLTRVTKIGEFMKLAEVRYSLSFLFLEFGSLQDIMVINCTQQVCYLYADCREAAFANAGFKLFFSFNRRLESTKTTSPTSTM